jgi:hypothetical protein
VEHSRIVESEAGRILGFETQSISGGLPRVVEGDIQGEAMTITVTTGEGGSKQQADAPTGLGPWALTRKVREMGYKEGTSYEVPVFMTGLPTRDPRVTITVRGDERIEVGGKERTLHKADVRIDLSVGLHMTLYLDDDARSWVQRIETGNVVKELRKVTEEQAHAPNEELDIMVVSMVKADKTIKRSRRLEHLKMRLEPVSDGEKLPVPPGDAWQDAERTPEGILVSVRRAHPDPDLSYEIPYRGQRHAGLLKATHWLEVDDERIREMTRKAVGDRKDALEAAQRLEFYVRRAVKDKNYGMGMATAAEVARKRAGDCTEHALLLAAMARAAGIPSRAASGLVYMGPEAGAFGFHMWTEVWVGEWYPLDAALFGHDATHIVLGRSDLAELDLLPLTQVVHKYLGRMRAHIIEASHKRPDGDR